MGIRKRHSAVFILVSCSLLWLGASVQASSLIKLDERLEHLEFRGQWVNSTHYSYFEAPSSDPDKLEVWGYTDHTSYAPGETLDLHVNTTATSYDLMITRDGGSEEVALEKKGLPGKHYSTPRDVYKVGAGWPVSQQIRIPADWKSGGYVINLKVRNDQGKEVEQHAFFILRPAQAGKSKIAFVAATTTWQAYNDWGGSNLYEGIDGPDRSHASPILSDLRPWSRGMIRIAQGAPRNVAPANVGMGDTPRYPALEYAYARGYPKFFRAAGWATYDRLFAQWAERNGYVLDYYAQDDLDRNPDLLKSYQAVVIVGHDEYQSRKERQAIDDYVEEGGHLVRLAGNVLWQVRREGNQLVCYKTHAEEVDPVRNDPGKKRLLTTAWESQAVNWPSAQTYGVNGLRGIYMKMGAANPRASGGFTVYRPDHWALEGTDLYYGDVFGAESLIAGYEGDGLDYIIKHGLPYPTGEDGAPKDDIEIIAMALATQGEVNHGQPETLLFVDKFDLIATVELLFGEDTEENRARVRYGSSMIVNMKKGRGEVFTAGTTEWVKGLEDRNPFVEKITHNVLERYTGDGKP